MHRTIFDTPILNKLLAALAKRILKLKGWKVEGSLPSSGFKSVLIAAPHTSNWDLPYTLMVAFALKLNVYWMGKEQIFRPPLRGLMRWLGGIPVCRDKSTNMVASAAAAIKAASGPLQLVISPEGTRSKSRDWKTGFYYIALGAKVPIVLAYLDYEKKIGGLGPVFDPTGDIAADIAAIKAFYAQFKGRHATQFLAS